ncbi:MAG: hypothetical protein ABEN55_10040 [Bradymonadaceae bacterium]
MRTFICNRHGYEPYMRQVTIIFLVGLFLLASAGCASDDAATADLEGATGRTSDGALMKLHTERDVPVLSDWKPTPKARVVPEGLGETARAFDYWRVVDRPTIDRVWGAVFPVVDSVRAGLADGDWRETLELMLTAIEPGSRERPTGMDLTFLVGRDDGAPFEGMACRLFRQLESGATPVLTVLMLRRSEQSASPNRIVVWAAPGFREPPQMTAFFRRTEGDSGTWRRRVTDGLAFSESAESEASEDEAGPLVAKLLTDRIWKRFAGRSYLQSDLSEKVAQADRIAGPDPALGLTVSRREIEQVYSDTEFPPRAEFDDLR